MPADKKYYYELSANEILKMANKASFDHINGIKVLAKHEVDLRRHLQDSERTLDEVIKLRRLYSKRKEDLTKELEEMKGKVAQADSDRTCLSVDLDAEKKRSEDSLSAYFKLGASITVLCRTKLEMEKVMWE
ncbi:hypothetical protein NE237_027556 [Protea cynaroides]|uniref:Uncharacterized protein n=1 Tax=Protea cynaroides TaxID=273540 RepID=A0A9Q0GS38_9MAGN|nr:hypothetical protein NE237_027556 [Protea cynaroides]